MPNRDPDWFTAPAGDPCLWCSSEAPEFEPADDDDAEQTLCRGHLAEFLGESLASLDRRDAEVHADMANLGYFDN
jgi:hypothetical protein